MYGLICQINRFCSLFKNATCLSQYNLSLKFIHQLKPSTGSRKKWQYEKNENKISYYEKHDLLLDLKYYTIYFLLQHKKLKVKIYFFEIASNIDRPLRSTTDLEAMKIPKF